MDHLTSLKANSKFRDEDAGTDLSKTVTKAKTEFGIDYFFVWHAITGYWAGVDLDSPHLNKYSPRRARLNAPPGIIEIDPDMKMFFRVCRFMNKRFGVVPPTHIRSFYDDYHSYLRSQGVDGVKVDAQSVVNFIAPGHGGSVALSRAYHQALSKSVIEHFSDKDGPKGAGGRIIHCMCHDNEILLQLPSCYGRRPLIRGSDDFYPRDAASHGTHLYSNAFNGMLLARCGLQDWDMFQTNLGPASWLHAASRAISGGPVYISDRPGNHNTDILRRMVLDVSGRPSLLFLMWSRELSTDPTLYCIALHCPGREYLAPIRQRSSHCPHAL
jgi:raffinose synthase